jgi:hypothetical protein
MSVQSEVHNDVTISTSDLLSGTYFILKAPNGTCVRGTIRYRVNDDFAMVQFFTAEGGLADTVLIGIWQLRGARFFQTARELDSFCVKSELA